jgi:hypothetical protein
VNALAPIQTDEFEVVQRTARMLAISAYFDAKGDSPQAIAQVATKILAGRELGFGPFAAVQGIHIISGKPAVGANLMAAAVKGSGRYDYRVRKMADDEVVIEFFAVAAGKRESLGESSFTLKDAQAAAVTNNPTWKKFPRNMLFARAMSNGVRWYCPDVFSGNAVYVPEELGATVDDNGDVIETTGHVVMEPRTNGTPAHESAPLTADVDMGMGASSDANPFDDAPWYAQAKATLSNGVAKLADAMLQEHRNSAGPCSAQQYGYLVGLVDSTIKDATGAADGHKRVLAVVCQSDISKSNRPGDAIANKLLNRLATHVKDGATGDKLPNPDYSQPVADAIVTIYRAAEAASTPKLIEA